LTSTLRGTHLTLLVGINVVGGLNLVAAKIGLAQFPPMLFTALRFGTLALLLLPLLRVHRGQMLTLLAAVLLSGPATFGASFAGMAVIADASTVAIATQMVVPISTLLSVWLLGERIRWRSILGITLAFGGMVVISIEPRVLARWEGVALVVLSSSFAALGMICVKRLRGIRPLQLQAWIAVVGATSLLLLSLSWESNHIAAISGADWQGWGALLFTTLIGSLIAHTAWFHLMNLYPVTSLSPLTVLTPLFGMFFGVTLLHDHLTPRMLVGSVITLLGILIILVRRKKLVDTAT
jgi:O-acetylserine/cysteine efflux transporter